MTVSISSGAACFRSSARTLIFARRPDVEATLLEVCTSRLRSTALLHHSESPVLLRHLQKIVEPLLEGFRPAPAGVNPTDTDSFVGRGETLEVAPGGGILFQGAGNVGRDLCVFLADVLNGGESRFRHPPSLDESPHPLAVHVGELAGRFAR